MTIDGFVFDGNNPSLNQTGAAHLGGVNIDGQDAITNYNSSGTATPISNLMAEFNIIQNFGESGITLDNGNAAGPAANSQIQDNLFTNIGNDAGEPAFDVALLNNAAADVQANTINVAGLFTGLELQNFSNVSQSMTWSGNTFTVGQDATAIDINSFYSAGGFGQHRQQHHQRSRRGDAVGCQWIYLGHYRHQRPERCRRNGFQQHHRQPCGRRHL